MRATWLYRRDMLFWVFAGIWLIILAVLYLQGISGTLFYDDIRPLNRLGQIDYLFSFEAADFVLGEISGPLGRPIAMLSFLPHYVGWPDNVSSILLVNVLIHLLNGVFVYLITRQLLGMVGGFSATHSLQSQRIIAALAALLWLSLPIHAATVLIPIQRMALLSTTFVLLGVVVYLAGLQMQARGHRRSVDVQLIALAVFLPLAALSKENGALLPLLLWVIEVTLLRQYAPIQQYRRIRIAILSLAVLAILAYLGQRLLNNPFAPLSGRDFSIIERLLTQPLILVDYLRQSFWPVWQGINPFQDYWRAVDAFVLFSLAGLAAVGITTWLLAALLGYRHWPWFAFATLWFFMAHLLESTTIGLELSFLHRNYLPLVGLAILLALVMSQLWRMKKRLVQTMLVVYVGFLGVNLGNVTVVWGKPEQAAQVWFEAQPASGRAATYQARFLGKQEDDFSALQVMEQHLDACPDCANSRAWMLTLTCNAGQNEDVRRHFDALVYFSKRRSDLGTTGQSIESFHVMVNEGRCTPGENYSAYNLLERLIETRPAHARRGSTARLWFHLGRLYMIDGDIEKGMEIFQRRGEVAR